MENEGTGRVENRRSSCRSRRMLLVACEPCTIFCEGVDGARMEGMGLGLGGTSRENVVVEEHLQRRRALLTSRRRCVSVRCTAFTLLVSPAISLVAWFL